MSKKTFLTKFHKYDHFDTWSSFSIGLIDIFIPIFLYQRGFSFEVLLLFFLLSSLFSLLLYLPICYVGNKVNYKWILIFSVIFFFITYYLLYDVLPSNTLIYLFTFFYSLYKSCYEIGKRYYLIVSMPLKDMGYYLAKVTVGTVVATLFASFLGSFFVEKYSIYPLLLFSSILYMVSLLFILSFRVEKSRKKISLKEIFHKNKISNFISIFFYNCLEIEKMIFPLYLYFYILKDIEVIGIFNGIVSIFSFLFILTFSRKMDKDKKDYIFLSAFLLACIFLLKIEMTSLISIYILGSIEGIISSLYQVGMERNLYYTASHYETGNYVVYVESISRLAKCIFFTVLFFLKDIKIFLFILSFFFFFIAFIPFDDGRGGYKN